jgi:methionyl-tRNA formyltransferase
VDLRFAFLVLEEHPYGREMLRILLKRKFRPGLIIEEVSPVADEERHKFLTRIAGQAVPPTIAQLVAGSGFDHVAVPDHNGAGCRQHLEAYQPDLIVLGGTRILRSNILTIPPRGTLNAHPGLLPWLRGSSSVAWALYKNLPIGSTVHFVERGIDTGPILLRRELPVYRGQSYEQIVRGVLSLSGELMAESLELLALGEPLATPQDTAVGETLRVIPPEYLAQAKAKLAQGDYRHFSDQDKL